MTKPSTRKPSPRRAPRRKAAKAPAPTPAKRTPAERKAKAIELLLIAIAGGWSLKRFARRSGVSVRSLLRWVQEPSVHPRYIAAMQTKAMLLPDEAMDMVRLLRDGGETVTRPDPDKPGEFIQTFEPVNVKAVSVALRHLEFRMMREIKAIYQPSREVRTIADTSTLSDERIDARVNELLERARKARQIDREAVPAAEGEAGGGL